MQIVNPDDPTNNIEVGFFCYKMKTAGDDDDDDDDDGPFMYVDVQNTESEVVFGSEINKRIKTTFSKVRIISDPGFQFLAIDPIDCESIPCLSPHPGEPAHLSHGHHSYIRDHRRSNKWSRV